MYDLIIIGAGPAGITGSIYAARKKMKFIVLSRDIGGQTLWSAGIENYTGHQFITGQELVKRFTDHLEHHEVTCRNGETVTSVAKDGDLITVTTGKGSYETRTLLIASGMSRKRLGVEGEMEFAGKGVAYCATCDAPIFAGMDVAVVGGGNSAFDAVVQLVNLGCKVSVIDSEPRFRADPVMVEKAMASGKVTAFHNAAVSRISGDGFVQGISITENGAARAIPVRGVFIEIGWDPSSDFAGSLVKRNSRNEIVVNCKCETNVPGIFAAGDVTTVPAKQIIVACGEGAKAVLSAFEYLNTTKLQPAGAQK